MWNLNKYVNKKNYSIWLITQKKCSNLKVKYWHFHIMLTTLKVSHEATANSVKPIKFSRLKSITSPCL
jgi:hypothetical protein